MKKKLIWKLLLVIGICPFIIPFVLGFYRMSIESWTMGGWLVLYSFIYWPTYLIGFVLIVLSLYKLFGQTNKNLASGHIEEKRSQRP